MSKSNSTQDKDDGQPRYCVPWHSDVDPERGKAIGRLTEHRCLSYVVYVFT